MQRGGLCPHFTHFYHPGSSPTSRKPSPEPFWLDRRAVGFRIPPQLPIRQNVARVGLCERDGHGRTEIALDQSTGSAHPGRSAFEIVRVRRDHVDQPSSNPLTRSALRFGTEIAEKTSCGHLSLCSA